ncbi:MAG: hypothetical protein IT379_12605 [Deltaproteobacteria bacterium]|nr:hypothetical protein [Deltaproteobacteria bacterium]
MRRTCVKTMCLLATGLVFSCGGAGLPGAGGGLGAQCRGGFGATAEARKLSAFVEAATNFATAAEEIQASLLASCKQMGEALGMEESALQGEGTDATRRVCTAVSDRLRADLTRIRGAANVTVDVRVRPPRCEVSVDAYAQCAGSCEVDVEPGSVQVQCEGGELRGGCSAECTGHCAAEVSASCSGTCEGACEGECSARAEDGSCNGRCSGSCSGHCVAEASGRCEGECRGGCSVAFTEPRCTGTVQPPNVSADCRAACDARLDAQATCQPGEATLVINGELDGDLQQTAERATNAVRAGLGTIMTLRRRLDRLQRSGRAVVEAAGDLPDAVGSLGVTAAGCAAATVSGLASAVGSVSVSVEVSVQVSGSASASGG